MKLPEPANPTYACIGAFVDELCRAGIHHAVICPGSRSTPLAIALAAQPGMHPWIHIDERSAAFFALGMAKRLDRPVALLCTSGTAAANFLPAIVEARLSHVPLLVLTADRPHELRDCGAPQAIDQNHLYGSHVKWFMDMALPEATSTTLRLMRTIACRAAALAAAVPAGPVHLNFPFREPLTPEPIADQPLPPPSQRDPIAWQGRPDNQPYVAVNDTPPAAPSAAQLAHLANLVRTHRRGLIIAGPATNAALAEPLICLACCLDYPILADPLSQLRSKTEERILSSYEAFLRAAPFAEQVAPELVLRFGSVPTAKSLQLYLNYHTDCIQIVIDGSGSWEEPSQRAAAMIHADPAAVCRQLCAALTPADRHTRQDTSWLTLWQQTDRLARETMRTTILGFPDLFEGRIFLELATLLPEGATLYVGNSMPVRDLDTFFWCNEQHIRIMGNRGANGIDGIISSALGASAGANEPVVLVIGDLSFFHDLNGLLAARLHRLNLTIILINNDGGGIFSFLPQAAYPEFFEHLFGTPTGLDFRPTVEMYGGTFSRISTWEAFRAAVQHSLVAGGLHVIEVPTERQSNVAMHRQLWRAVAEALQQQQPWQARP
jgi:2-succinyl-5-enolpyruvyl-6-hydroxy-3-cyclohexene-1-carboxylate synthase